jgi:molecular chaperone IbpA
MLAGASLTFRDRPQTCRVLIGSTGTLRLQVSPDAQAGSGDDRVPGRSGGHASAIAQGGWRMNSFDLSPLWRSSIGFDRVGRLFDSLAAPDGAGSGYPPYNIEKTGENGYRITMAVAGFTEADLDINVVENVLTIRGKGQPEREGVHYLHRGIATRAFERRFELADSVRVASAQLVNGLLHVELVREIPEHKRPRRIEIVNQQAAA